MLRNTGPGSTRIILNRSSTASSTSTISPSCSATNNPAGNTVLKLLLACCFLSLEDQRKSYLEPPSYKMSSTPFPRSSLPFWCTCPSAPHRLATRVGKSRYTTQVRPDLICPDRARTRRAVRFIGIGSCSVTIYLERDRVRTWHESDPTNVVRIS